MNLPTTCERPVAGITRKKLEKAATILQNVFRSVIVEPGKVERILGHRARATTARGKTIGETSGFERGANECLHTVEFAPVEPCLR